jgi:hypothetical protein
MSRSEAGFKGRGDREVIRFVYGAPELGGFRLVDREVGEALIAVKACATWGALATARGHDWREFVTEYEDQLATWSGDWNDEEPIHARTRLDPVYVLDVFQVLVGPLPDAAAAYQLMNEIRDDRSLKGKLVRLADLGGGAPGAAFDAVMLDSDKSVAAFQRALDEHGYTYIRLTRDDDFVRKVFA